MSSRRWHGTMPDTNILRQMRRKFLVAVNTGYVTDSEPDRRYIEFYARRSSPALHCGIIGNVVIPDGHGTTTSTPSILRSQVWSTISRAISDRGSIPGIQLSTVWAGYQGARSFRAREANETI